MSGSDTQHLAADIERQRDELAGTVDTLHHKLDLKPRRPQLIGGAVAVALVVGLVVWRRRHR